MRVADRWQDFEILDTSSGEKLERWGDVILARPDPQVIWHTPRGSLWQQAAAHYRRSSSGGGHWENRTLKQKEWQIGYHGLCFSIRPTGFKHTVVETVHKTFSVRIERRTSVTHLAVALELCV